MHPKDRTGLVGEELAAEYLHNRGHRILAARWRSDNGELDLVTEHFGALVAVEVKTRRGLGFGDPLEAVSHKKLRRIYGLLAQYAAQENLGGQRRRVDVVGVLLEPQGETYLRIDHLQDVQR